MFGVLGSIVLRYSKEKIEINIDTFVRFFIGATLFYQILRKYINLLSKQYSLTPSDDLQFTLL